MVALLGVAAKLGFKAHPTPPCKLLKTVGVGRVERLYKFSGWYARGLSESSKGGRCA